MNKHGELEPAPLAPSKIAKDLWIKAYDAVEKELAPRGGLVEIKPFAAKAAENILRISGVIQCLEDTVSKTIGDKAMRGAIQLMLGHYLREALRLTTQAVPSEELSQAQKLLEWLQAKCSDKVFTVRHILQYGPAFARSKRKAETLIRILIDYGWIEYV